MTLGIEKYLPHLDQYDWSLEEKIEMLHAMWRLTEAQADKAFGLNSMQLSCGQNKNIASQPSPHSLDSKAEFTAQSRPDAANDDNPDMKGDQHAA